MLKNVFSAIYISQPQSNYKQYWIYFKEFLRFEKMHLNKLEKGTVFKKVFQVKNKF